MMTEESKGWNAFADFLAAWLKGAIAEVELGPKGDCLRAAWGEVLNICQSERKDK